MEKLNYKYRSIHKVTGYAVMTLIGLKLGDFTYMQEIERNGFTVYILFCDSSETAEIINDTLNLTTMVPRPT